MLDQVCGVVGDSAAGWRCIMSPIRRAAELAGLPRAPTAGLPAGDHHRTRPAGSCTWVPAHSRWLSRFLPIVLTRNVFRERRVRRSGGVTDLSARVRFAVRGRIGGDRRQVGQRHDAGGAATTAGTALVTGIAV